MDELQALPNIGPVPAETLRRVGICTLEDLRALGAEKAFCA